jgi:1-acyl-sn-glycerol-3-phosphate acyltransferase
MVHTVLYLITVWIVYPIIRLFLWKTSIQGVNNIKDIQGPLIIASNHRGRIDAVLIWCFIGHINRNKVIDLRVLTWHAFFSYPVLSWYLYAMRCYPIENRKGLSILDPVIGMLKEGNIVTIFPEGKMQKHPDHKGDAKRGVGYLVWKSQAPVLPVYINYRKPWKYIPIWGFTLHIGKITSYDTIKSEDEIQKVADDVLESVYELDKK